MSKERESRIDDMLAKIKHHQEISRYYQQQAEHHQREADRHMELAARKKVAGPLPKKRKRKRR